MNRKINWILKYEADHELLKLKLAKLKETL